MPSQLSLADFNRIATGTYNAGQIDIATAKDGSQSLVKVNNHVWFTSRNKVQLAPERVLEVKEAFIAALKAAGMEEGSGALAEIRKELGIPVGLDAAAAAPNVSVDALVKKRFTPLSREQVRTLLDTYANGGSGFTKQSRGAVTDEEREASRRTALAGLADAKTIARRDAANAKAPNCSDSPAAHDLEDAFSLVLGSKSLKDIDAARRSRIVGTLADTGRDEATAKLRNGFGKLFAEAFKLLSANVRESGGFTFCGVPAKIVKDDGSGDISVVLGTEGTAMKAKLGVSAPEFVNRLIDRALGGTETLGGSVMKDLLTTVFNRDVANSLPYNDRGSLTRQFASKILAGYAKRDAAGIPAFTVDALVSGDYQTMVLAHIAQKALEGEDAEKFNTRESLNRFHEGLKQDSAGLSQEMKDLIAPVKDIPIRMLADGSGEFVVAEGDQTLRTAPKSQAEKSALIARVAQEASRLSDVGLSAIGGAKGIKDFIADLIFSDETMVADVTARLPGETMREILSDAKRLFALAEIIRNPGVIDTAVSPKISNVVKEGFNALTTVLDAKFEAATHGESLADAAKKDGFVRRFAEFFMDPAALPGEELAKFDAHILAMSTKGCEKLQGVVNEVFNVADANEAGAVTTDPYKGMSDGEIVQQLAGKTLNEILDEAATADAPGQVGFFKQVVSNYFMQLRPADRRSAFAASLRYAKTFETGENMEAQNAFAGAVLKGAGPLLQKMMQGLPKAMTGRFSDALEDMKANLAPLPRKVVQAYLAQMIRDSHDRYAGLDERGKYRSDTEITAIKVQQSLGAASVGEAFLCKFTYKERQTRQVGTDDQGRPRFETREVTQERSCVVKIMRHDAEKRMEEESKIFTAAAAKIPGMSKTWEGQLQQYKTEFDFQNEARNVEEGERLYGIYGVPGHELSKVTPHVSSMKMSPLVPPKKNVMVADLVIGQTVDKFFKTVISRMRDAASAVFERDQATGRVLWQDSPTDSVAGVPVKVPVLLQNASATSVANFNKRIVGTYDTLRHASATLQEATKAWFYQALLGDGQFHGDAHAGNLMMMENGRNITFIDFGNLYKLDAARADGVNEKSELLRVILGAAFRNGEFVLKGVKNLMSPEGRAALNTATEGKARAILEAVLEKGSFSFNIVYRLQAAVVELQKLGLELPPQINCFIQSLVRLSNTVAEINTIMNQCKAMMDAVDVIRPATEDRDELDLVGRAFDMYASAASSSADGRKDARITNAIMALMEGGYGARGTVVSPKMFQPGGAYVNRVVERLANAGDTDATREEAERLFKMLSEHRSAQGDYGTVFKGLDEQREAFRQSCTSAATPEEKAAAIQAFAEVYAATEANIIRSMARDLNNRMTTNEMSGALEAFHMVPPTPFASALTELIADNFEEISKGLSIMDQLAFLTTAKGVITGELGIGLSDINSVDELKRALQRDARRMGGDYQISISI